MTKTLDVYIGELCPWPESVHVIQDMTSEIRSYIPVCDRRSTPKELLDENAKLHELVADLLRCVEETSICDNFYYKTDRDGCGIDCYVNGESCSLKKMKKRARSLGIEV